MRDRDLSVTQMQTAAYPLEWQTARAPRDGDLSPSRGTVAAWITAEAPS